MMISIAYITGFCCIIMTCIGMWQCIVEKRKLFAFICFLLAGIALVTSLEYVSVYTEKKFNQEYKAIIAQKDAAIESLNNKPVEEFYYADAEITKHEKQSDGTYKIQFLVNPDWNVKDYVWYEIISNKEYDIMVPYLLTINSNGTKNTDDDRVVAVWACMK